MRQRRWTRWLLRGALALLALVLVAAGAAWWLMRGSLPRLDGELALPGLSAPVTVQRDALGVVTIDAANAGDALRALGYVHAQERYFEMDLLRRTASGELAELFGPIAIDTDKRHRVHRMRARATAQLADFAGAQQPQLQAYTDGVNAGLAGLRTRPWPYLLLRQRPAPWTPVDSALTGQAMYFDLQGGDNARELALWKLQATLPAPLHALLSHDGSRWDAPLQGAARGDALLPGPDAVDLRRLPAPADDATDNADAVRADIGSNNFAVAGTRTADGRAIVADDMHLGLRAPNIWFRARLRYADPRAPGGRVDVSGFTLPGLPGVVVGSNSHVAWGFTNSYGDWLDWQRVPACTKGKACAGVREHSETIRVAGAAPVDFTVRETDWGPILHKQDDGSALALRWAAHLPGSLTLNLLDLSVARDLDDALAKAQAIALPAQNLLVGDRSGRIAWRLLGPMPRRDARCDRRVDAPSAGGVPCAPWPLARHALQIVDPAGGALWTANSRVLDGDALAQAGNGGYALGARAAQIRDGLAARRTFTERDLLAIQLDDRALFLQRWWALLRERASAASTNTPALDALAGASSRWDGRAAPESISYRIVRAWRLAVQRRLVDGLTAPARAAQGQDFVMPSFQQFEGVAWPLVTQRPGHLLPRRFTCTGAPGQRAAGCPSLAGWDGLFEDAAREVRDELEKQGPLPQRSWGERNTARICHPLSAALPKFARGALCMPSQPLPGDTAMPRVQGPDFGASQRMVVSPGHEADGIAHMPGGQSGHPLSPFWGAGHDDWVRGRPSPFLPGATQYTLRMQPPP